MNTARILVVDDESPVRSFLCEALQTAGHDVDDAADGAEASSFSLTTTPPSFDCTNRNDFLPTLNER